MTDTLALDAADGSTTARASRASATGWHGCCPVLRMLQAHGERGISPAEIARRTGMAKRSIYRDLNALQTEMQVPLWSDRGKWGVQPGAFLPPLRLTLPEAMAVFLSARLVDPLRGQVRARTSRPRSSKLGEALPDALREHVERTLDDLAQRRVDPDFNRHVTDLTRAWAERRVVALPLPAGPLRRHRARGPGGRGRAVPARAVARDPRAVPHRARPDAGRHPDVQGGADRRPRADAADVRGARGRRARGDAPAGLGHHRRPARRPRSCCASSPSVAGAGARGDVAPEPGRRGAAGRLARVARAGRRAPSRSGSGSCPGATRWRSWSRPQLRADVAATHARAASRYGEG